MKDNESGLYCIIPTVLHRQVKAFSALNGIDVRDFVQRALERYVDEISTDPDESDNNLIEQ